MWRVLQQHFRLLIVWGAVFALYFGTISLMFPFQYRATSRVLVITRDRMGVDIGLPAKSAELIGKNLAAIVNTTDFFGKVMETNAVNFDKIVWQNLTDGDRRYKWQRDVKARLIDDTSLLRVTTYAATPGEAKNLNNAVAQTLVARGGEYTGGGVTLKQVDEAQASRYPVRPRVFLCIFVGFITGVLLSGFWLMRYRGRTHFGRMR